MLATKVHFPMHDGPGGSGLSRKAIMEQIDASLTRLGTDYVDLYQIHRFDPNTPVEETMEALHDVVKAGKARYLGASSMWAWQFAKMQHAAELHGWTKFVAMQDHYNLLQREEEREMFGLLADQGVGAIPWSPLAKGRLARPYGNTPPPAATWTRSASRFFGDGNADIVTTVQQIAEARGIPWPRSRWPGCCATRSSPHPSSAPPSHTTCPTPSQPSTSPSPTTRSPHSRSLTSLSSRQGSDDKEPSSILFEVGPTD